MQIKQILNKITSICKSYNMEKSSHNQNISLYITIIVEHCTSWIIKFICAIFTQFFLSIILYLDQIKTYSKFIVKPLNTSICIPVYISSTIILADTTLYINKYFVLRETHMTMNIQKCMYVNG